MTESAPMATLRAAPVPATSRRSALWPPFACAVALLGAVLPASCSPDFGASVDWGERADVDPYAACEGGSLGLAWPDVRPDGAACWPRGAPCDVDGDCGCPGFECRSRCCAERVEPAPPSRPRDRCAEAGATPSDASPCCEGLEPDASGRCAEPAPRQEAREPRACETEGERCVRVQDCCSGVCAENTCVDACRSASDCDDGDRCTASQCTLSRQCAHFPVLGHVPDDIVGDCVRPFCDEVMELDGTIRRVLRLVETPLDAPPDDGVDCTLEYCAGPIPVREIDLSVCYERGDRVEWACIPEEGGCVPRVR